MTSVIEISPAKPVARTFRASQALERFVVPVLLIAGWEAFARSGYLPPAEEDGETEKERADTGTES